MTQEVSERQKSAVIKTLAIIGFVAFIIFSVWLAVQVVRYTPTAFSSVASLLESVETVRTTDTFTTTAGSQIVQSGEVVTIDWSGKDGVAYTFSYECVPGVLVTAASGNDGTRVECETAFPLGSDTFIDIRPTATEQRFSDITYTVRAIDLNSGEIVNEHSDILTLVNADISTSERGTTSTTTASAPDSTTGTSTEETSAEPDPTSTVETTPTAPAAPAPRPQPIYATPTSDPNGFVDLGVTFIAYGTLDEENNFTPRITVDNDDRIAVRFEVRNLGTKTSDEWTYTADFPGVNYTAEPQAGLRPNERARLTLGFTVPNVTGSLPITAEVETTADTSHPNDSFTERLLIVE